MGMKLQTSAINDMAGHVDAMGAYSSGAYLRLVGSQQALMRKYDLRLDLKIGVRLREVGESSGEVCPSWRKEPL